VAREALRAALYACGIDHDSLEFISEGCLTALRGAGLLGKSLREVVGPIDPDATAYVSVAVFQPSGLGHSIPRSRAVAEEIARAIQAEHGGELENRPHPLATTFDVEAVIPEDMVKHVRYAVYYTPEGEHHA
jgi:hypothetical protein